MERITIHAVGKLVDSSHEGKLIAEYIKRIPWKIAIKQLDLKEKFPAEKQKIFEGEELLKSIPSGSFIIAMDERGKEYSSKDFAGIIEKTSMPISFIIGGAFGLSEDVRKKANLCLALGKMTLPHMLARLVLVEQIYRGFTIINNHPYHK